MVKQAPAPVDRRALDGPLRRESVKKNVAAIHVSGKLTLLQRKLANVLLLNAYDHLTSRTRHKIDAKTLCVMIGYNSNDLDTLKGSLKSLAETVCEWDMLDEDGKQEWGVSALLAYAKLKGGVCEYGYSPILAEKLHDPKIFALINLDIQRRFTSGHGLALYENCYRFVRTGSTGWWSLELFRRLMGVEESPYYQVFKNLNAKIVKPAVAEVNRSSNIEVAPEVRREGRAVAAIRFRIRENAQFATFKLGGGDGVEAGETYGALIAQGVSDRLARQWIGEHGERYVAEKLSYVTERRRRGGVRNAPGYLTAAIEGDFKLAADAPEPTPEEVKAAQLASERVRAREAAERAENEARAVAKARRLARVERVLELVEKRNPTQRDVDRRAFAARLRDEEERADFARHGWRSALCAGAIFTFWEEREPGLFDGL